MKSIKEKINESYRLNEGFFNNVGTISLDTSNIKRLVYLTASGSSTLYIYEDVYNWFADFMVDGIIDVVDNKMPKSYLTGMTYPYIIKDDGLLKKLWALDSDKYAPQRVPMWNKTAVKKILEKLYEKSPAYASLSSTSYIDRSSLSFIRTNYAFIFTFAMLKIAGIVPKNTKFKDMWENSGNETKYFFCRIGFMINSCSYWSLNLFTK